MPDTLSLATSISVGLLAGIVSGVCYLVANGLTWPQSEPGRCISESEQGGLCNQCGGDTRGDDLPCICFCNRPVKFEKGAWFLQQVQKTLSLMPWSVSTEKLAQIEEEREGQESDESGERVARDELRNVRHFLETLSARLAGGPLDRTRVQPLYDHPTYLPPPRDGAVSAASASSGTSIGASGAHAQLKRLVARVVEEAAALPALARYATEPTHASVESTTYEDLLATAILNKVIERYQTENGSGGRSSGIHSASASPTPSDRSSPRSLASRERQREVAASARDDDDESTDWEEGEVTDDTVELPRRVPFPEFGGDIVHSRDNLDRDYDEVSGSDIQAVDGTWEENWLFQKKKIKTLQSVPVPMLVPNSNAEYRALIGDRDAEDTTDLSDNASDAGAEDNEIKSNIKRVLDSKHIIGGAPKVDDLLDFEPDSLTSMDGVIEFDSFDGTQVGDTDSVYKIIDAVNNEFNNQTDKVLIPTNALYKEEIIPEEESKDSILIVDIDSGPLPKAEFTVEEIHRTCVNGNIDDVDSKINTDKINAVHKDIFIQDNNNTYKGSTNTLNGHEREGEYEETVTLPVQRYADSLRRRHFDDIQMIPTRDTDANLDNDLIPGSIADRERKKWLNYVEMPNNPYSPDAIKKRLSARSSSGIFDTLTTKQADIPEVNGKTEINYNGETEESGDINDNKLLEDSKSKSANESGLKSPTPKILKDVLAEEVPQYKRYGRDYYVREAKKSSGGRKKLSHSDTSSLSSINKATSLDNFDAEFASPGLLIEQFNFIASNEQFKAFEIDETPPKHSITTSLRFNNNKHDILIEYEDVNEQTLFSAKPAYINEDVEEKFEQILQSAAKPQISVTNIVANGEPTPKSPTNLTLDASYISTSSNEDSIKIYNVQKGEIVKADRDNLSESRYDAEVDSNDNLVTDKKITANSVDALVSHKDVSDTVVETEDIVEATKLDDISELEELQLPKVKELAKIFINMESTEDNLVKPSQRRKKHHDFLTAEAEFDSEKPVNKYAYMHSLTARSISKEFRDELKLSMATPLKTPGGSKEIPEGIEEVSKESSERPDSPLPEPGTIKNKLAFFESLKTKFNTK